jgi:MtN3 and saliva related transmembrane protein
MNTLYITIIGLVAAFCTTISFLPQAIKTIQTKNTSGISLSMYFLFAFGTLLWLVYGLLSLNIPIIIANAITLVFASIILVYKVKYN